MDEDIARLWLEWGQQIRDLPTDDPTVVLLLAFPLWTFMLLSLAFHKAWGT